MDANLELMKSLSQSSSSKIIMLVMDGLGGLPDPATGKTELETARTPNLDRLAYNGECGLSEPVGMGITPGSAPGHLGLFGYDPPQYNIGRGILEAIGIDFDVQPGDVASRGNFCTVNEAGLITDRRAGRVSTDKSTALCKLLDGQEIEGVKILVRPVREHRFVAVFRGEGLGAELSDSDPQKEGLPPKQVIAMEPRSEKTAMVANAFAQRAKQILSKHAPANMILLRGFSKHPHLPSMEEVYKLKPAAIATYPMYRGLASLAGMDILKTGTTIDDEFSTLKQNYADYDFFFIHIKPTDAAGEDGDFARKVRVIEQVDAALPAVLSVNPEVLIITGDHSTPAVLKGHSWHPVPVILYSKWCRPDRLSKFGESECRRGGLGRFPASRLMAMAMANALKLTKYGA